MQARRSPLQFALSMTFVAALAAPLVACAAGAEGTGSDDDPIDAARIDAPNNPNVDARVDGPIGTPDARLIDAPTSSIDAPIGLPDGGIMGSCTVDTECPSAECCFVAFCVPGTRTGLPSPLNCAPD